MHARWNLPCENSWGIVSDWGRCWEGKYVRASDVLWRFHVPQTLGAQASWNSDAVIESKTLSWDEA